MTAMKQPGASGVVHATQPQKVAPRTLQVPESLRTLTGRAAPTDTEDGPVHDPTQPPAPPRQKLPLSWALGAVLVLGGGGAFVAWQMIHPLTPATGHEPPAQVTPAHVAPAQAPAQSTPIQNSPAAAPTWQDTLEAAPQAEAFEQGEDAPAASWDAIIPTEAQPAEAQTEEAHPTDPFADTPNGNDPGATDWSALLMGR